MPKRYQKFAQTIQICSVLVIIARGRCERNKQQRSCNKKLEHHGISLTKHIAAFDTMLLQIFCRSASFRFESMSCWIHSMGLMPLFHLLSFLMQGFPETRHGLEDLGCDKRLVRCPANPAAFVLRRSSVMAWAVRAVTGFS